MKKFTLKLFAATILLQLMASPVFADEPVRITSDGKIVDDNGNVIAVQNHDDSRNNDYEKYYMNVDASGNGVGATSFYIVSDPNKGFVRKELATTTAANETQDPPVFDFSSIPVPANVATTTAAPTSTTNVTNNTSVSTATANNAATKNLRMASKNLGFTTTTYPARNVQAQTPQTTTTQPAVQAKSSQPVSSPALVDAPVRNDPSDPVYSNTNDVQTLYGQH